MPYSTLDDLKKKIDEPVLVRLTDTDSTGAVNTAKVERAIRDADALIDSYVGKIYKTPLSPVPPVIADASATIAIVYLHMLRSAPSPVWEAAYDRVVELLQKVVDGAATLEGSVEEPALSRDLSESSMFSAALRRFSREKLEGM